MNLRELLFLHAAGGGGGEPTEYTDTGNPATFTTNLSNPLSELYVLLQYTQDGTGNPTPSNVRPISGVSSLYCVHAGKNMAQLRGYSATNKDYDQDGTLSNNYGTTINTTEPASSVVITQSSSTTDYDKPNYRNGYISIRTDNMVDGQYYDVSFKITDITSNPLNASLSNWQVIPGQGSGSTTSEVKDNVLIFKNILYKEATTYRQALEVRNCGMSCTLSEFMVTPANTNDGVYKAYNGTKVGIEFPALTKNICPPPVKGISIDGQTGAETTSETRATTDFIPVDFSTNTNYRFSGMPNTLTMWANAYNADKVSLGRTSSAKRTKYTISATSFGEGSPQGTGDIAYIRLTFSAGSGASIDDVDSAQIQLEAGSSETSYVPYTKTVYGGVLDILSGTLTLTHISFTTTWGNGYEAATYTETQRRRITISPSGKAANYEATGVCDKAKWRWNYDIDEVHFYIHNANAFVFLPIETAASEPIQFVYELATPITVQLAPTAVNALKGANTIWTNTSGNIGVKYWKKG